MVSEKIRKRIEDAGARYWACDNISEFIENENEMFKLVDELADKFNSVLDSLLIDRETDPNSKDTGRRLAKMYLFEIMKGRYSPAPDVTAFPNDDNLGHSPYTGMLTVRTELRSMCSHHHQPVKGVGYIGVVPGKKVIGLSKYTRIAQWCARRGTLQEELANHIAREISKASETNDVGVYLNLTHGCCENRGVMLGNSGTQTTVLLGSFQRPDVKQEFFDTIRLQEGK